MVTSEWAMLLGHKRSPEMNGARLGANVVNGEISPAQQSNARKLDADSDRRAVSQRFAAFKRYRAAARAGERAERNRLR
jgi:hypothetical protein